MMNGIQALRVVAEHRTGEVVITTMAATADWQAVTTRPELDLPLGGAMGKASSLGLGLALARPQQRVLVLDGDGSLLMNLGSLVTVANLAPENFVHVVYENDAYDTTGGQPVPGAGKFDFAAMALAAGYRRAYTFDQLEDLSLRVADIVREPGPVLVVLKVASEGRRPPSGAPRTSAAFPRLREHLQRQEA